MKAYILMSMVFFISTNCDGLCYLEDDLHIEHDGPQVDFVAKAREALIQVGNRYEHEPTSVDASLAPELVLNTYWRSVQGNLQEEKDAALKTILDINFSSAGYCLARYHYAAAVLIGANFNTIFSKQKESVLSNAVLYQDNALCQLLFIHGANPNSVSETHGPVLYMARKVTLIQLLFDAGVGLDTQDGTGLEHSFYCGYEPSLVRWYIEKGVNPLARTKMGTYPFKNLIIFADYHSIAELEAKTDYFFEKLNFEESKNCIEFALASIHEFKQTINIKWLANHLQNRLKTARIS